MARDPYTNGVACDILANEGTSYAVQHYCDGSSFKDPETARLWQEAGDACDALEKYLREETGRDDF